MAGTSGTGRTVHKRSAPSTKPTSIKRKKIVKSKGRTSMSHAYVGKLIAMVRKSLNGRSKRKKKCKKRKGCKKGRRKKRKSKKKKRKHK